MIDFKNASYFKLKKVSNEEGEILVSPLLVEDEIIVSTYKSIRDEIIFTNKRIIAVNVQGITGTKKDFTSMPYSKIQVYSVETVGLGEKIWSKAMADCELELYFSGIGKVKFEFKGDCDIIEIGKMISTYVLR